MGDQKDKKTQGNQSAVKTLKILEALAADGRPKRLKDLAESVDMNASTTLRFLNSLEACGYVHQDTDTQKYTLTLRLADLSKRINSNIGMKTILHEVLADLAAQCNESACLAIEYESEVLYLDVVEGPVRVLNAAQHIGHRAPLHCTGIGKLLLLNYTESELISLTKKDLKRMTEHTITTLPELRVELDKVRKQSWAMDDEECEIGLRCIAAPIVNGDGKVIAAMSITGPVGRLTEKRFDDIRYAVLHAVREASAKLGY